MKRICRHALQPLVCQGGVVLYWKVNLRQPLIIFLLLVILVIASYSKVWLAFWSLLEKGCPQHDAATIIGRVLSGAVLVFVHS